MFSEFTDNRKCKIHDKLAPTHSIKRISFIYIRVTQIMMMISVNYIVHHMCVYGWEIVKTHQQRQKSLRYISTELNRH